MTESWDRGRLIVLSGPSGVGKDTVIEELRKLRPSLRRPAAYTTRLPRPGEVDERDYSFVDLGTFGAMEAAHQFLETASVHGNRYGTSRERVEELLQRGDDVLLKLDVQGAAKLRQDGVEATFVFLAPPSREVLLERLLRRETESDEELALRTRDADRELAEASWYHHVVVNDEVDRAAREVAAILADPDSPPAE
ncbi:MAG TPA: guanylate kinase [Candidatus Dormibacteraeota bacterium]|nr:guanylate kinase [Candidatus Dormibacteraeota bacterium]